MSENISLEPVGIVSSNVTVQTDEGWGGIVSKIELFEPYRRGIEGLEGFSHVIAVTYLHQAAFDPGKHLVRRPRGLSSMPNVGIFAQRAKDRPNRIGITTVRLLQVGNGFLEVRGLDAIDGTPVLDIKPYYPAYDLAADAFVPEWAERVMENYF